MQLLENISLRDYNTFGIDVRCGRMVVLEPGDVVPHIDGPYLLLGAGSDMVFTKDYDGTVLRLADTADVTLADDCAVTAWGGMTMDDFVAATLQQGLYGLENLSAIPGTVGAAAVQNVGAYGVEAKDVIDSVEAYDLKERRMCRLANSECGFAYRDSMFKQCGGRYLILRVTFRLRRDYVPNLSYKALEGVPHSTAEEIRGAITDMRWQKLPRPEEHGSAGSFFKNPVVDEATYRRLRGQYPDMPEAHRTNEGYKLSAGWIIDKAGWKGKTMGRAGVWPQNALVLYNAGGCNGAEVMALAGSIQQDVAEKFGVHLSPEAIII